jgi:hypothetical protein
MELYHDDAGGLVFVSPDQLTARGMSWLSCVKATGKRPTFTGSSALSVQAGGGKLDIFD